MIMNKPKDFDRPSKDAEYYKSGSTCDCADIISKVANELYRADLAADSSSMNCKQCNSAEQYAPLKSLKLNPVNETADQLYIVNPQEGDQISRDGNNRKIPSRESMIIDNQKLVKQISIDQTVKIPDYTVRPLNKSDDSYYFMPGYNPSPYGKQAGSYNYISVIDVNSIRKDFPILQRRVNGKQLVWLDNAATTQKPECVINALNKYYSEYNSNIHRGAHTLSKLATNAYEAAREKVRSFIGAQSTDEIIFVRGTTEAVNLVAESYGGMNIQAGDEILLTMMEHHSNIVPWQKLQQTKGAIIKVIPVNDRGEVILDEYERLFTHRTRIAAITHVSNVLGTINPIRRMIDTAHKHGAIVLVDGAQSIPHIGVDIRELDADFYAFSGHKVYGPTGIGVLYGKRTLLEEMPPWQRGGGMIKNVSINETSYNSLPYKFEAGTGSIADAVGLGAAIDYIRQIGIDGIERHEKALTAYAMEKLYQIPGLHIIGTAPDKTSVIAFVIDGVSPENAAQYLNQDGIAVRSGHHCAQPILHRYGLTSTIRASLGMYNTREEVDSLVNSVLKLAKYYN